jgi:heme exporter protein A
LRLFKEPMALLEGYDLVCVRGERTVFAGLAFSLDAGGALLIKGPNGSGKSSLLRLAAGLLRPAGGTLSWQGNAILADGESHRARLCYVGHQDPVKPALTVRENLTFWARLRNDGAAPVGAALERLGLSALAEVPGRFLSAGQKRRLNLARLLANPVPLWLLDEPTAALDGASTVVLEGMLAAHRAGGGVVLLATHAPLAMPDADEVRLEAFAIEAKA